MIPGYNVRKAAQLVAFFANRQGGSINVLKLSKLVYLADREFLSRYDCPILYDKFVSMDHGPVNSVTLNFINGCLEDKDNWDNYVSDREGHSIGLPRREITTDQLDQLSDAEIDVLEYVWKTFGWMDQYQVRDWTHENCLEWENPHGSSHPIPYERVLKFLGKKNCEELDKAILDERELAALN